MRIPLPRRALRSLSIITFIMLGPYLFLRRLSQVSLSSNDSDSSEPRRQSFLPKIKVGRQRYRDEDDDDEHGSDPFDVPSLARGLGIGKVFGSRGESKDERSKGDAQKPLSGGRETPPKSRKPKVKAKPKRPKGPQHTYSPNGLLIPNPLAQHPIWDLLDRSKTHWQDKLDSASTTLAEAVDEYRRRYGRSPPKGFDRWYVGLLAGTRSGCLANLFAIGGHTQRNTKSSYQTSTIRL